MEINWTAIRQNIIDLRADLDKHGSVEVPWNTIMVLLKVQIALKLYVETSDDGKN